MFRKAYAIRPVVRAVLTKAVVGQDGYFDTRERHPYVAGFDIIEEDDASTVVVSHEGIGAPDMETLELVKLFTAAPELLEAATTALSVLADIDSAEGMKAAEELRTAIRKAKEGCFSFQRESDGILLQNELGRPFR